MGFLEKVIEKKRARLEERKKKLPLESIVEKISELDKTRNFKSSISKPGKVCIIAEMKKSSPSAGLIRADYDVLRIARDFVLGDADAILVLTEEDYFSGDIMHVLLIKDSTELAVLRKDFIIDEYQIYESRYFGADAITLIASILSREQINEYYEISKSIGLDAIVEIHNEDELNKIYDLPFEVISVNNRDLETLKVDPNVTLRLVDKLPQNKIKVSENDATSKFYIQSLRQKNINAVIIGEMLMKSDDVVGTLKSLRV